MNTKIQNVLLLSAVVGATSLGGCSSGDADGTEAPPERAHNVRVLELARTDLEESIVISGPLRPVRGTDIATQESGVIRSLPADRGSVVRQGQVVVMLDRRLLESEMKSAEATRILHEYNEERTRRLFEANSVSRQEMLRVHTELQRAGESERVARLRYERAAIKAPFDGMVADRYIEVGELVSPGMRVARIVDPFTLKLVGSVTEAEVASIEKDAPAQVSLDAAGVLIDGAVSYVGIEASPANGKFTVEVMVENPDLLLRAGVVARARVRKAVHGDVIAIPRDAIVRTPDGLRVYVVEEDRAIPRSIELGADQGLMVEVRRGLVPGDRLVVRGQRQLAPEGLVAVQEVATARDGSIATDPPEVREEGSIPEVPKELAGDAEALR
jgi:membrane fusion protein (multidrug efflux system)